MRIDTVLGTTAFLVLSFSGRQNGSIDATVASLMREVSMTADEFKDWRAQIGLSVRNTAETLGVSRSTVEV